MTKPNEDDRPMVVRVEVNGVELPVEVFAEDAPHDQESARIAELFEDLDADEEPGFIISTASSYC